MTIAVHLEHTAASDPGRAYEEAWRNIDAAGLHHPEGRISHTAWLDGDRLHVLDVWDSPEDMDAFVAKLRPILDEVGLDMAAPPQINHALKFVRPD